ncbi:hypothetical protein [Methylocaldum gracile]|jgi:hypothetical protein|uniref:hypothetical protein n=1 Tax=Methylocaldum sp. 0917 TaxID=2485163 RepID=UPI00105DD2FC
MATLYDTAETREALLKEIFGELAKALDLRHDNGQSIEAAFEPLGGGAAGFAPRDRPEVLIDTYYLSPGAYLPRAISVYTHECAHKLTDGHAHDFVFFTLNLALHFRAEDFLSGRDGELYRQLLSASGHPRLPLWHFAKFYDGQDTTIWPWDTVGDWLAEGVRLARRVYQTDLTPQEIAELARETARNLRLDIVKSQAPRGWRAQLWRLTPEDWLRRCACAAIWGAVAGAGIIVSTTG